MADALNAFFGGNIISLPYERPAYLESLTLSKDNAVDFIRNMTTVEILASLACLYWALSSFAAYRRIRVPGAAVHGYWSWFEPTWLLQLRYAFTAHNIISSGYLKVRNRPSVFQSLSLHQLGAVKI